MFTAFFSAVVSMRSWFQTHASLQVEILALRHQVAVLKRSQRSRLRLNSADRLLWVGLSRLWSQWRSALLIVKPETVIAWHRRGFRWVLAMEESAGRTGKACDRWGSSGVGSQDEFGQSALGRIASG